MRAAVGAPIHVLRGRVIRSDGTAVADVGIGIVQHGVEATRTGSKGSFELRVDATDAFRLIAVVDARWTTLRYSVIALREPAREHLVIAAPVRPLEGRVVDETGVPLARASIRLEPDHQQLMQLARGAATNHVAFERETDIDGRFTFMDAPEVESLSLWASRSGCHSQHLEAIDPRASSIEIVLRALPGIRGSIEGRVVDQDGAPVEWCSIVVGKECVRSRADGSFWIAHTELAPDAQLVVRKWKRLPTVVEHAAIHSTQSGSTPQPLVVVLGGPALSIAGRVVDEDGAGLAGWSIGVLDGERPDLSGVGGGTTMQRATSRADGSFELEGLAVRTYRLRAIAPDRRQRIETDAIDAGTKDIVIRGLRRPPTLRVRGRVVMEDGTPADGADVHIRLDVEEVDGQMQSDLVGRKIADRDGWFEIRDVPAAGAYVQLSGSLLLPRSLPIEPNPRGDVRLELRAELPRRLEIGASEVPAKAAFARILNASGRGIQARGQNELHAREKVRCFEGVAFFAAVGADPHTIVFVDAAETELSRARLAKGVDGTWRIEP